MDLNEVIKTVDKGPVPEVFFRGHASNLWPLQPTLMRSAVEISGKQQINVNSNQAKELIFELESALYWEFRVKAFELHSKIASGWDYLFWARHHGVPTRLLDWSENLFVALYFALIDSVATQENPMRLFTLNS